MCVFVQPIQAAGDEEIGNIAASITGDVVEFISSFFWLDAITTDTPEDGYVLFSSLRAIGNRMRLESRLKSPDGDVLWSDKFDAAREDAFDFQDTVSSQIVAKAVGAITDAEWQKLYNLDISQLSAKEFALPVVLAAKGFDETSLRDSLERCVIGMNRFLTMLRWLASAFCTS